MKTTYTIEVLFRAVSEESNHFASASVAKSYEGEDPREIIRLIEYEAKRIGYASKEMTYSLLSKTRRGE